MTIRRFVVLLCSSSLLFWGCGDSGAKTPRLDGGADASPDADASPRADASPDADASPRADASPDADASPGDSAADGGDSQTNDMRADTPPAVFQVRGVVSGLDGNTVVLQNNAGETVSVSANGAFAFATALPTGALYAVTVQSQPTGPAQVCSVSNGAGTIGSVNVTGVVVTCATTAFVVRGTISGLNGTVVLGNNGGNDLSVATNGPFAFSVAVASGATYAVTVRTQPTLPAQTCVVAGGTGTVGGADVSTVVVTCTTTTFAAGGTVSGLGTGATVILQNNAGDSLSVSTNGAFVFATPVASGSAYAVTVQTQPSTPTQVCTVTNGSGTVGAMAVTVVSIACLTRTFTVGGTVLGLATGASVVLQNSAGDALTVAQSGAFTFATPVGSGAAYAVAVLTQPSVPVQTCVVSAATGTVGSQNVTGVVVNCATNTFTVGGTIAGLNGSVVLRNNAGDDLTLNANGTFAFATPLSSGSTYAVTVQTQPSGPSQTCTVTAAPSGTVTNANVTNVVVTCATNRYSIGGTISGLAAGATVVLQDNATDDLARMTNGTFTFATAVASGSAYSVTVLNQPSSPAQVCVTGTNSGTVGGANITTVTIVCTTTTFTVGGNVSGLLGSGLVLRNNGGDNLTVLADGGFTFATRIASGLGYAVTVFTQPTAPAQTCTAASNSGTVGAANIGGVSVTCTANFGSGSDGALTVAGAVVINNISTAATGTTGQTTLTLDAGAGFSVGQSILIHQSQGTNAGDWERAIVAAVAGNALTLTQPLQHSYTSTGASNHAQAVVAPQYTTVTVPAGQSLSAPPWNGVTGGILVFNATGAVTIAGTASMKGRGFRGGVGNADDPGSVAFKTQGESYLGLGVTGLITNLANAGGGNGGSKQGGCEGGGGGGGGYAAAGTNGGPHGSCFPIIVGGIGGGTYGDAALAKVFFGSGGGSGGYSPDPTLGRGGDGGGIVMVFADQITISSSIDAGGNDGTLEYGDYGGGGGGAGGSVYLSHVQPVVGFGTVNVGGGTGGLANGRSEIGGDGAIGRALTVP